jgi:dipeptidyl aminopeptidase/acylaminoacyl peptidase
MDALVTFRSEGQLIFGNLHMPHEGAACVVALHGLESSKDSGKWSAVASRLLDEGYACLRFNFRGCGEGLEKSEGEFEDLSLTGRIRDYKSALDFLQTTGKVDMNRVAVIGSSLGGMVAIAAQDRRVKAMVTLASPYKIPRYEKPLIPREEGECYVLPSGRKFKKSFYEDLQRYDLLQIIRNAPPILLIHGSADEVVPLEHAHRLYEAAGEPKRLEIVEGADHRFSNGLDKAVELTLEWFKEHI